MASETQPPAVDTTLIDEMLRRTPEERLEWLAGVLDLIDEARGAREEGSDQPPA